MNENILKLLSEHKIVLAGIVCVLALLGYITSSFTSIDGRYARLPDNIALINPAIESSYTDLDGKRVSLDSFKGRALIVNSWATWMPFSQTELELLNGVSKEYGDKIVILAINRMEEIGTIKSYLEIFGLDKNVIVLTDPTDHFYKNIAGYSMPETVFYTRKGEIVVHKRGVLTSEELSQYIKQIIVE